jgi:hypothetical protein
MAQSATQEGLNPSFSKPLGSKSIGLHLPSNSRFGAHFDFGGSVPKTMAAEELGEVGAKLVHQTESAPNWYNLTPFVNAEPSFGADGGTSLLFDPSSNSTLVYGASIGVTNGSFSSKSYGIWSYQAGRWDNVGSSFPDATELWEVAAGLSAWDQEIDSVVFWALNGQTWTLSNWTWTNLSATSPAKALYTTNFAHNCPFTMDSSPGDGGILMLAGVWESNSTLANGVCVHYTWLFANEEWANESNGTQPSAQSSLSDGINSVYDPAEQGIILWETSWTGTSETWIRANQSWTNVTSSFSAPPLPAAMTWDSQLATILAFENVGKSGERCSLWALSSARWSNVTASYVGFPFGANQSVDFYGGIGMAYDSYDGILLIQGYGNNLAGFTYSLTNYQSPLALFNETTYSIELGKRTVLQVLTVATGLPLAYSYDGLPPGCESMNVSELTCEPNQTGTFFPVMTVRDTNGSFGTATTEVVVLGPVVAQLSESATVLDLGMSVWFNATAFGVDLIFSYSGLPTGCSSTNVSHLRCTPTAIGASTPNLWLTDGNGASENMSFGGVTVNPALQAKLETNSTLVSEVGIMFSWSASGIGGTQPYVFDWSGLPQGCGAPNSSRIVCIPSQTGNFEPYVSITDGAGSRRYSNASLTIRPALAIPGGIQANPGSLTLGGDLDLQVEVTGGVPPVVLTYSGLPPGCGGSSEFLNCTPTTTGMFTVTISVHDSVGANATASTAVSVSPRAVTTSLPLAELAIGIAAVAAAATIGYMAYRRRPSHTDPAGVDQGDPESGGDLSANSDP